MVVRVPGVRKSAPLVASERGYLRGNLPAIYSQNGDFALRFLGSLERLLDPIVALLDALPAHVDPALAPADLLELFAAWLGIELDESWPEDRRRELIRRGPELARRRGTRAGLELALGIAFPDLPLRIEETGGVAWAVDPDALPAAKPPSFVVYCDVPLEVERQAAVAIVIDRVRPVNVSYRLRVKAGPKSG
jgi:phage tail-like protein